MKHFLTSSNGDILTTQSRRNFTLALLICVVVNLEHGAVHSSSGRSFIFCSNPVVIQWLGMDLTSS